MWHYYFMSAMYGLEVIARQQPRVSWQLELE
jgi:hypothetical protein